MESFQTLKKLNIYSFGSNYVQHLSQSHAYVGRKKKEIKKKKKRHLRRLDVRKRN